MKIIGVDEQLEAMYNIASSDSFGYTSVEDVREAMFMAFDQEYGVKKCHRQWKLEDIPSKKQLREFEEWLNEDEY